MSSHSLQLRHVAHTETAQWSVNLTRNTENFLSVNDRLAVSLTDPHTNSSKHIFAQRFEANKLHRLLCMAEVKSSWDIVDLTAGTENDVDLDVENLRAAASRAQNAASQYLEHTMSLESAHSAQYAPVYLSSPRKQDDIGLSRERSNSAEDTSRAFSAPEIGSSSSENVRKSHNKASQVIPPHVSNTSLAQPHSNAADSGLGESVSETEDSRPESPSPMNSLSPHGKTTDVAIFGGKKRTSAQQSQKLSLLHDAAGELRTSMRDQPRTDVTIPRTVGRFHHRDQGGAPGLSQHDLMAVENPRRLPVNSFTNSEVVDDEHPLDQTQTKTSTPKKRRRPCKGSPGIHPYRKRKRHSLDDVLSLRAQRSPIKGKNKTLSQTRSRHLKLSISERMHKTPRSSLPHLGSFEGLGTLERDNLISNVYQQPPVVTPGKHKAEDILRTGSSLADRELKRQSRLRKSLEDTLSLPCNDDFTLAETLKEVILPILEAAIEGRKGLLPENKLISIAKTVSFL